MYYFAYGSNMSLAQMRERCSRDNFSVVGKAQISGYALAFTRKSCKWNGGVADLVRANEVTWGVCYQINDYALGQLDCSEGFSPDRPEKRNAYNRRPVRILLQDGTSLDDVWCYFANPETDFFQPSKRYLDTMISGAVENGLPPEAVQNIKIKGRYDKSR